jgi:hypothetical protein
LDPKIPYAYFVEEERTKSGVVENIATVFLTNRECPWKCLMCDLWKNTLDHSVSKGDIPNQMEYALDRLPKTTQIKLYNSGSFFDKNAIPPQDLLPIANILNSFERVIVECHPSLIDERVLTFNDQISGNLEIAMGLECVHPDVLDKLNKGMDLEQFREKASFLNHHGIAIRVFTLLRPPFLSEEEGIEWGKKTLDFAFENQVEVAVVIPTRAGNGALEALMESGDFHPPEISSLEQVTAYGIKMWKARIFADLLDIDIFSNCNHCLAHRKKRLTMMNELQVIPPVIACNHCGNSH